MPNIHCQALSEKLQNYTRESEEKKGMHQLSCIK